MPSCAVEVQLSPAGSWGKRVRLEVLQKLDGYPDGVKCWGDDTLGLLCFSWGLNVLCLKVLLQIPGKLSEAGRESRCLWRGWGVVGPGETEVG